MDWELAYPELLPLLNQWRRFFRNLGPLAERFL